MKRNRLRPRLRQLHVAGEANSELGVAPREFDFPFYSLKDGFHSTLTLVSDSPRPIALTLGIRNLFGQMLTTTATIQPQQKLAIDLAKAIAKAGGDPSGAFAEGSVAIYFMGTIMTVAGQMTVTNPALSPTHQVDMVENNPGHSDIPAVLNGAWWGLVGGNEAQVFVSNMSGAPQFANVDLDFQGKRHAVNPPLYTRRVSVHRESRNRVPGDGTDVSPLVCGQSDKWFHPPSMAERQRGHGTLWLDPGLPRDVQRARRGKQ